MFVTNRKLPCFTNQILSFVYESKSRPVKNLIPTPVRDAYSTAAHFLKEKENVTLGSSSPSTEPFETSRTVTVGEVVLKVASQTQFSSSRDKTLFFAFLVHLVLLHRLSSQDRARKSEPMQTEFKHQLTSNFLPKVFRAVEDAITSLRTIIDVDVRVFITLVRFLAENHALSMQGVLGDDIACVVRDKLSPFSVPISTFSQFAAEFLPLPGPPSLPIENSLGLLPFSNKIFDDELAPIRDLTDNEVSEAHHVHEPEEDEGVGNDEEPGSDEWDTSSTEEEAEEEPSQCKRPAEAAQTGYFDDGTLFNDTRHWHNHKRPILPKHLGGDASPANVTEWQRRKRLRADQRFMKTLHDQAATLTGASGTALHQIKIPPVKPGQHSSKVNPFTQFGCSVYPELRHIQ